MKKRIVIKVGTGVLVTKTGKLDQKVLSHIVDQMAALLKEGHQLILVSSGAVGAGRELISFKKEEATMEKRMLAAVGQTRLMEKYRNLFEKYGIEVAQILPLRDDFHHREKYITIRDTLERLMTNRIIPILNENDVLASADLRFSDNDNLAALTAVAVKADHIIFLTDIKGLYDANPDRNKNAKLIKEVKEITPEIKKEASGAVSKLGLGGMINKLVSIEMCTRACIEADICYGKGEESLSNAALGLRPGTHFPAICHTKKAKYLGRKAWLAAGVVPTGSIVIDEGAYDALKKGKSLLAVGVKKVMGQFNSGDVVSILDQKNIPIGTGMVHCSSEALNLKDHLSKPVIHADNLVVW
ncbi:glutamate 5-kinase [Patescibacteria group bacterium]|nr:glutamate 5-kinase [Patescibacteria group bacterium]MBU1683251.1 glutamate 5-kinase [Patescibacteria group bacterium]